MDWLATCAAIFLVAAVEVVEVVTIVLALGLTRGWQSPLIGVGAATVVLAIVTALVGPALMRWVDLHVLQVVVGFLLLVFGLQWLRKAILRASGHRQLTDEDALFQTERAQAAAAPMRRRASLDWFAFTVAFKGMLLEGLEVVFIVLTIGAAGGRLGLAAAAAGSAAVIVGAAGVVARHPLSRVPENNLKFAVGILLTTFGTFWAGEGVGVAWVGDDLALVWLLASYVAASFLAVRWLARARLAPAVALAVEQSER